MSRKNAVFHILLIIVFTGVECDHGHAELYSKLLNDHKFLVPPSSSNVTVSVNMELVHIQEIDTRNQEMTFSAIINLHWRDSTLSWNQKEFPFINHVTLPHYKIWTPDIVIWNSDYDSKSIQQTGGYVFISSNGQVHWPVFGRFHTTCTIDVTYYPFDQQTCVIKIGPRDFTIQIENQKDRVDLNQFYMSVVWTVIEAPAYRNVYLSSNSELPAETDVSYYLVLRRRTHWLSEVCPLLAFAFLTIIPAAVTRSLEKVILQVFCIAGVFALHKDIMTKLPPTALVTPLVSKYIVALILCNLIHLTLTTIINNCRREYFDWITKKIPVHKSIKRISSDTEKNDDENGLHDKQDIEIEEKKENLTNRTERQTDGDKIIATCNWIIFILLIFAVVISTLYFLFDHPH